MNKKQAQEQFDVVLEKINNLTTEAEKLKEIIDAPQTKIRKPEHGEKVWYYNRSGYVTWTIFDCNCGTDISMHELDSLYRTKEDATFERDRKIFMAKLRRWALNHNDVEIDWDCFTSYKYFMYFHTQRKEILHGSTTTAVRNDSIYFSSLKILQDAIDTFGESDIKKYMFGITE